jgi:hypothetical protein
MRVNLTFLWGRTVGDLGSGRETKDYMLKHYNYESFKVKLASLLFANAQIYSYLFLVIFLNLFYAKMLKFHAPTDQ